MHYARFSKPVGVRVRLRDATDAAHQRMHGLEPFRAIAGGKLTAKRYRQLLQSLLLFHSAIGAAAKHHGWASLSSAPARTELLRSDLRGFGGGSRPALVPWQVHSPLEALGALYAAEGSLFGGRVIAAQLDYLFGSAREGRRFFIGTGDGAARWRTLLAALEDHCTEPRALDRATDGAHSAFDLFEKCVMGASQHGSPASSAESVARLFAQRQVL